MLLRARQRARRSSRASPGTSAPNPYEHRPPGRAAPDRDATDSRCSGRLAAMASAPLPEDGLDAALRPFGESRMLPVEAYTRHEVFAWERRHLFAGSWMCLGRTADLAARGNQHAVTVGDLGVLLTLADDGVHAFANACRHRGHELLPAGGSCERRAVVCPYHGWSYDLAGALRTAPRMGEGFDHRPYGLVALPAVDWHGWVFVNAIRCGDGVPRPRRRPGGARRAVRAGEAHGEGQPPVRDRGELEGDRRELPRVLSLPADPPGAVPGDPAELGRQLARARAVGRRLDGPAAHTPRRCRWTAGPAA